MTANKENLRIILFGIAVVILIGISVGIGHHYLAPSGPSLAQEMDLDKHPIPSWVTADAQQCQGDFTKLSPQEQQKISAQFGPGAKDMISAAYATQH